MLGVVQGKFARESDFERISTFFFGGTFDPPHRGHYRIVSYILTHNPGARVIVMPAASSPLRGDARLFSYRQRFEFLHRLFSSEIAAGRVVLSILEKKLPKPNFTYNTLEALAQICPIKPVLVIGADQAQNLPRWYKADDLMQKFSFLVFARGGSPAEALFAFNHEVVADFDEEMSATALREKFIALSASDRIARVLELIANS